ncbi:MAG: hypothetical protein LBG74_00010 [Spirochaetaceae bacterium]|jgi:hypothetical protein|nr:hypothetical protein [Spirochaetaceae bacterium]
MPLNSSGLSSENSFLQNNEKSRILASTLFPGEAWIAHGEGIFIAKSRLSGGHKEQAKLYREIADARILTSRGSVAYFLPERSEGEEIGKKYADTVIDGAIVELKTVSGNRTTLGKSFKKGYKQGQSVLEAHPGIKAEHDVFLRLFTPFTVESVRAKLAGELKNTTDKGRCICHFEATGELFSWDYDELRAITGTAGQ